MDDQPTYAGDAVPRGEAENAVSPTTAFELLARRPRRQLLYWLHQRDDQVVTLDALVRRLRDGTADSSGGDPGGLRLQLHHVHLPKLDDADVVEYDPDGGEVHYRGDPRLQGLLEWGIDEEVLD